MRKSRSGFTIVELLIVIVVIAILATISVVAYSGIQNRTHDTAVKSDLTNLKKLIEAYAVLNGRHYPANHNDMSTENTYGFSATKNSYAVSPEATSNITLCRQDSNTKEYAIVAISKSGNRFYITNSTSVQEYTGDWNGNELVQSLLCAPLGYESNFRGYALDDTTNGPWRGWVGGN